MKCDTDTYIYIYVLQFLFEFDEVNSLHEDLNTCLWEFSVWFTTHLLEREVWQILSTMM